MPRNNLEKLEQKQRELLASIPAADWQLWKASGPTKALLMQFEIDYEDLKDNLSKGGFSGDKEIKAQGQAEYISGIQAVVDSAVRGANDED